VSSNLNSHDDEGHTWQSIKVSTNLAIVIAVIYTSHTSSTDILMNTFASAGGVTLCRTLATDVINDVHSIVLFWEFEV
jgi:hypothetical protein